MFARIVISVFVLSFLLVSCTGKKGPAGQVAEESPLPNIVLLVGDDHGYPYFGFMGADYVQTPQMDKLAAEGMVFENAYVPSNHCAPSLQSL